MYGKEKKEIILDAYANLTCLYRRELENKIKSFWGPFILINQTLRHPKGCINFQKRNAPIHAFLTVLAYKPPSTLANGA